MTLAQKPPLGLKDRTPKKDPRHLARVAELPCDELHGLATYDPETGFLFWKERSSCSTGRAGEVRRWNARFAGKKIGTISRDGYLVATIYDQQIKVHRLAYALHYGRWPENQIDHINGDRTDNRIANLRDVDARANTLNRKRSSRNKTGAVGVCRSKYGTFIAYISTPQARVHIGTFRCFGQAVAARRKAEAAAAYHPNHGRR